ncbi:hypothetical protein C8F04DRAFT_456825 [Mycena alexandri]|uniref:Uncharacterized protein n=1 Tax=Mycena alexandri TaxID=1745969 RepID=A0AAD6T156_9AGAR|nr:hypothetical protein C8F04DRAFT_456825 [Mycena alexandri]
MLLHLWLPLTLRRLRRRCRTQLRCESLRGNVDRNSCYNKVRHCAANEDGAHYNPPPVRILLRDPVQLHCDRGISLLRRSPLGYQPRRWEQGDSIYIAASETGLKLLRRFGGRRNLTRIFLHWTICRLFGMVFLFIQVIVYVWVSETRAMAIVLTALTVPPIISVMLGSYY